MSAHDSNSRHPLGPIILELDSPGLLDVGAALVEAFQARSPRLPALETVLARARHCPARTPIPAEAAIALLGEAIEPGEAYWLCASPVHLIPDRDHMVLWHAAALDLAQEEAGALAESFNAHFGEDGWELQVPAADRWYLRRARPLEAKTRPVSEVSGRDPFAFLPGGAQGEVLTALINETQMLFHDHPVNQARQSAGRLTVSGIWPWGGGCLPARETTREQAPACHLFSDRVLERGLAHWHDWPLSPLPESFEGWQAGRREHTERAACRHHRVVLEAGRDAAALGEYEAWESALIALEEAWWAPALAALRRGRIGALILNLGRSQRLFLGRAAAWRFWRRPLALRAHLQAQGRQA